MCARVRHTSLKPREFCENPVHTCRCNSNEQYAVAHVSHASGSDMCVDDDDEIHLEPENGTTSVRSLSFFRGHKIAVFSNSSAVPGNSNSCA